MQTFEQLLEFAESLDESTGFRANELRELVDTLATVQPPENDDDFLMHYIVLRPDSTGTSRKPGNIRLNWGKFFDTGTDVGAAAVGVAGQNGFVRAVIGLYIWNKVWRGSEAPLGDAEGSVIEALWRNYAGSRYVSSQDAFIFTNDLRQSRAVSPLSRREFEVAVDILVKMSCIKLVNDRLWLREWVRKKT